MIVELLAAGKGGALPELDLTLRSGEAIVAVAETERRPTVLSLIASGRMRPDTGRVLIDGQSDARALRAAVAVIDAPDVSDPADGIVFSGIVAEELMFAGKHAHRRAVRRVLTQLGLEQYSRTIMGELPPAVRIRALAELAVLRAGVQGLILTSPDRHGGEAAEWWSIATDLAARGYAVLVIVGREAASAIARLTAVPELVAEVVTLDAVPLEPLEHLEIEGTERPAIEPAEDAAESDYTTPPTEIEPASDPAPTDAEAAEPEVAPQPDAASAPEPAVSVPAEPEQQETEGPHDPEEEENS